MIVRIVLMMAFLRTLTFADQPSVKLLGKTHTQDHGVLVVEFKGLQGPVCSHVDNNVAAVVCRELGYTNGTSVEMVMDSLDFYYNNYYYDYNLHAVKDVSCYGNETSLSQCQFTELDDYNMYGAGGCYHDTTYAYVACRNTSDLPPEHFNISVGNSINNHGLLRMTYSNITGMICADGWDDNAALVACRTIDPTYTRGVSYVADFEVCEWVVGPLWTSRVKCTGQEKTLDECSHTPFGEVADCPNDFVAGSSCYRDNDEGIKFRMRYGNESSGAVQMLVEDQWQDLCMLWTFGKAESNALCRDLGYESGRLMTFEESHIPTLNTVPCWNLDVTCDDNAPGIMSCMGGEGLYKGKDHMLLVSCTNDIDPSSHRNDVSVKLMHGQTDKDGILLTRVGGTFAPVCHDFEHRAGLKPLTHFTNVEAGVACRQLGFAGGVSLWGHPYESLTISPGHNLTRDFQCTGLEKSLTECNRTELHAGDGQGLKCTQYAAVVCRQTMEPTPESFDLKLRDDNALNDVSVIELTYNGVQGVICGDGWNTNAAKLACKQMGYVSGINYTRPMNMTHLTGPVWTSNLRCNYMDEKLTDCDYTPFGTVDKCESHSVAAALCFRYPGYGPEFKFNAIGGSSGLVELYTYKQWGQICYDPTNAEWFNANLMCRSLGFRTGRVWDTESLHANMWPSWIMHTHCLPSNADDNSILDCNLLQFKFNPVANGKPGDLCTSGKVLAVSCYHDTETNTTASSPTTITTTDEGSGHVHVKLLTKSSSSNVVIIGATLGGASFIIILAIVGFLAYRKYRNPDQTVGEMFGVSHSKADDKVEITDVQTQK